MKKGISALLTICLILSCAVIVHADNITMLAEKNGIAAEIPSAYSYAVPSVFSSDGTELDLSYEYLTSTRLFLDFDMKNEALYRLLLTKNNSARAVYFKILTVFSSSAAPLEVKKNDDIIVNELQNGISFTAKKDAEVVVYPKDFEKYSASGCTLNYTLKTDDNSYDISSFIVSDTVYYSNTWKSNFFYKLTPNETKMRHTYNNPGTYWEGRGKPFLKTDGSANEITITAGGGKTAIYSGEEKILSADGDCRLPASGGIAWRICVKAGKTYTLENVSLISARVFDFDGKAVFYVDENGSDSNDGTQKFPFKTLERAVVEAAESNKQNAEIIINSGTYNFDRGVVLRNIDKKLLIKANGSVCFTAFEKLDSRCAENVTDNNILARLPQNAGEKVIKLNLPEGIKTAFDLSKNMTYPDFYQNGKKLSLSRWPDFDYNKVENVFYDGGSTEYNEGIEGSGAVIGFTAQNPLSWQDVSMSYMDHYGSNDWCREWTKIKAIDKNRKTITLENRALYPFKRNKRWSAVNVLEEIDLPGEYYTDWQNGVLYVYPYEGKPDFEVGVNRGTLIDIKNSSGITLEGIEFSVNGGKAVSINKESKGITVKNCTFHDTRGIFVSGLDCKIESNSFYNMTGTSITLNGGERETLTPTGNIVKNNHISALGSYRHNYGLSQCIMLGGVGSQISGNIIHGSAVGAIGLGTSNNNIISDNEIYNVINASADAGAVYAGCSLSSYGNVICDNYIHDFQGRSDFLTEGNFGLYMDDWFSGVTLKNNVLGKTSGSPSSVGIYIASGRDNTVTGNLMFNLAEGFWAVDRFGEQNWIPSERKRPLIGRSLFEVAAENTAFGKAFPQIAATKAEYLKAYAYPAVTVTERTPEIEEFWRFFPKNNVICDNTSYAKRNILHGMLSQLGKTENNTLHAPQIPAHNGGEKVDFQGEAEIGDFKLLYPQCGTVYGTEITKLLWENAPFADEYYYEISKNADFSDIAFSGTTISNGAEVSGLYPTQKYYVRVTAKNTSAVIGSEKLCGYSERVRYKDGVLTVYAQSEPQISVICAVKNGGVLKEFYIKPSEEAVAFFPKSAYGTAEIYFININNMSPFGEKISVDLLKGEQ